MDCTELDTAAGVVDFMVTTECSLSSKALEEVLRLSSQLQSTISRWGVEGATSVQVLPGGGAEQGRGVGGAPGVQLRQGGAGEALPSILLQASVQLTNAKQPNKLFQARRKRGTLANLLTDIIRTLETGDIEQSIKVALVGLKSYESDTTNDSANEKYRELMKELLRDIHDRYMAEMCKGATTQSPPEIVKAGDITVTMVKTEMNNGADEKFVFDSSKRSLMGASSFSLKDDIYNEYSEWNCGKTSTSGAALPCVGLCLGTAVLEDDFVSPTSERLDAVLPERISSIHDIRLLNPLSGEDLTPRIQQGVDLSTLNDPISLQLNIANSSKGDGFTFTCMVFVAEQWDNGPCETLGITALGDGTAFINCECSVPGFIAVFLTKDNKPLLQMQQTLAAEKEVRFTIKEDYYKVVTPNKDKFEASLRRQLSSLLRTDPANIRNLRIWPGSIEVAFQLVAPTDLEAGQQEQAMEEFAELVSSGKLTLTDADGNLLNVPRQCVNNCPVEAVGEDVIPVVIAAVAMAIVLFILVFIICAVCKKKKKQEKMAPFTPPSQDPTYRSFQFADGMEGTQASLARARKNSHYPDYDPGSNFNSRGQTQNSVVLHDDLDSPDSGIVRDAYGIPVPANYRQPLFLINLLLLSALSLFSSFSSSFSSSCSCRQPTEQEISLTQPIPEDMVTRSPARRLPSPQAW